MRPNNDNDLGVYQHLGVDGHFGLWNKYYKGINNGSKK